MKTLLTVTAAALALASCSKKADTTVVASPTETAMVQTPSPMANQAPTGSMAGTYEMTRANGAKMTLTNNADGTYTMVENGKTDKGTWRMDGSKSCYDLDGAEPEVCYTTSPVAADGSFTSTAPDGTAVTVRKTAAAPTM